MRRHPILWALFGLALFLGALIPALAEETAPEPVPAGAAPQAMPADTADQADDSAIAALESQSGGQSFWDRFRLGGVLAMSYSWDPITRQSYWRSTDPNRPSALFMGLDALDLFWQLQLNAAWSLRSALELGVISTGGLERGLDLTEAFVMYAPRDTLQLRLGKTLTPFNMLNRDYYPTLQVSPFLPRVLATYEFCSRTLSGVHVEGRVYPASALGIHYLAGQGLGELFSTGSAPFGFNSPIPAPAGRPDLLPAHVAAGYLGFELEYTGPFKAMVGYTLLGNHNPWLTRSAGGTDYSYHPGLGSSDNVRGSFEWGPLLIRMENQIRYVMGPDDYQVDPRLLIPIIAQRGRKVEPASVASSSFADVIWTVTDRWQVFGRTEYMLRSNAEGMFYRMGIGGGVNWRMTPHLMLRMGSTCWFPFHMTTLNDTDPNPETAGAHWQCGVQAVAGF